MTCVDVLFFLSGGRGAQTRKEEKEEEKEEEEEEGNRRCNANRPSSSLSSSPADLYSSTPYHHRHLNRTGGCALTDLSLSFLARSTLYLASMVGWMSRVAVSLLQSVV